MAIMQQPQNFNQLNALNFKFLLKRAPNVVFFITAANIPNLSISPANVATPFTTLPIYGDHVDFGTFDITFRVDEELANYREIFDWMMGIGFPKNFTQHKKLQDQNILAGKGITSDATLTILTSAKNSNIEVVFEDIWPTQISNIDLNLESSDVVFPTCTVNFAYKLFTINII